MQHHEIIQAIENLIPRAIEHGPETTLLKYASDENLSPAQLERVAQVYNTAMTLNFLEKSANRGGSFRLVEIPELLKQYTDPSGNSEKEATVPDDWAMWLETTEKTANCNLVGESRMPNIFDLARGKTGEEFVPETDQTPGYAPRTLPGFHDSLRKESRDRFEINSVNQIIDDAKAQFRDVADKLKDIITIKGASFSEMEREACLAYGDLGKQAADTLCDYFDQIGLPYERFNDTSNGKIIRNQYDSVSLFKEAGECVDTIKTAQQYLNHIKQSANQQDEVDNALAGTAPDDDSSQQNNSSRDRVGGQAPKSQSTGGDGGYLDRLERDIDRENKIKTREKLRKSKVDKEEAKARNETGKAYAGLVNDALGTGKELLNLDTYTGGDWDQKLERAGFKGKTNNAQKKIDSELADTRRVTTLQMLMLSDPIISQADPATVVELANTLAKGSPEIASDPNLMRMALREAIQYDAIPIHTFKDLVEINERQEKTEKERRNNEQERYRI